MKVTGAGQQHAASAGAVTSMGAMAATLVLTGCVSLGEPVYDDAGPPPYEHDEVPDLAAMLDEAAGNMAAHDSFRAEMTLPAGAQDAAGWDEMTGEDALLEITLAGATDTSAADLSLRSDGDPLFEGRQVEGIDYLSSDGLLATIDHAMDQDPALRPADLDFDQLEDDLDGRWWEDPFEAVDLTGFTPEAMVRGIGEDLQEDAESLSGELLLEADGYVYSYRDEEVEVVFAAEESPVLLRADYDEAHVELSGWDEEEIPGTPEDIISDRELEELLLGALGDDYGFGDGGGPIDEESTVPAGS